MAIVSCNNQSGSDKASTLSDSISANASLIRKGIDSAKVKLIEIQTKITYELDSLQTILNKKDIISSMGKDEFKKLKQAVGERLSALEKISGIELLEQEISNIYNEINNPDSNEEVKKQKLERLKIVSRDLRDSITVTLNRITLK
jgi:tRNA U34 5-carboxymethylaminomethyl modifying GTPase MnmE/TrmE